jgi:D-serine deaminase-like pyridoxal phosphate-dependent protein
MTRHLTSPRSRQDLPSPALLLDLAALEHNIDAMAKWASAHGVGVRPHAKAHKCAHRGGQHVHCGEREVWPILARGPGRAPAVAAGVVT